MALTQSQLERACRSNRVYARREGWQERFQVIVEVLGFRDMTPDEEEFAQAVARYQKLNSPLTVDGMLGPKTWTVMRPETRMSLDVDTRPPPAWLRHAPGPEDEREVAAAAATNVWFGLAVNYGGQAVVIGPRTLNAWLFSVDNYNHHFLLTGEGWRLGPGLGGSVGLALVVVTSLHEPRQMNQFFNSGVDVAVSLGGRWDEFGRSAGRLPVVRRLARKVETIRRRNRALEYGMRELTMLSPDDYNNLRKNFLDLVSVTELETDRDTPQMASIGIPGLGAGVELGLFWQFNNYRVEATRGP